MIVEVHNNQLQTVGCGCCSVRYAWKREGVTADTPMIEREILQASVEEMEEVLEECRDILEQL